MHEDAHLRYKWYKVGKLFSKAIRGTQIPVYTTHTVFLFFIIKKRLKTKQKQTNKQTNKVLKLDWLKPQHNPCKRS